MKRELRDLYYSIVPTTKYIQSITGNTNLILTAPHGGGMKPITIPKRKYGTLVMDTYTRRFTRALAKEYGSDAKPFRVIADIHRSRIDFNRDVEEAAQGNPTAIGLWDTWNEILSLYTAYCRREYSKTLYVDIHSHNDGNYFELGYNLGAKSYVNLYNNCFTTQPTTVDTLSFRTWEMLFGEYSMKRSLESFGYTTLFPTGNEVYFNGGRNIEVYSGEGIGAIQIEIPVSILKKEFNRCVLAVRYAIEMFRIAFTERKFTNEINNGL